MPLATSLEAKVPLAPFSVPGRSFARVLKTCAMQQKNEPPLIGRGRRPVWGGRSAYSLRDHEGHAPLARVDDDDVILGLDEHNVRICQAFRAQPRIPPLPETLTSENPAARNLSAIVSLPAQRSSHPSVIVAR